MKDFYHGKTVLVTGHSGFKGSWLCTILKILGANVVGYSLQPSKEHALFQIAQVNRGMVSVFDNICNLDRLKEVFEEYQPDIVFHLAAQPIVRESYKNPVETYATNVMGTVNIMECIRLFGCVKSFVNITTDKVYRNNEWEWGYRENDILDGFDPYSNSKSCSELVTATYFRSFFEGKSNRCSISTVRAGNVIGGGDFATDRIIPDCVNAAVSKETIFLRNPDSIRPYQHVLEALFAYLLIAKSQYATNGKNEGNYNIGPEESDCVTTKKLVSLFCNYWGDGLNWKALEHNGWHEACYLKLDCSKLKTKLAWKPVWNIATALEKTVEWYRAWDAGENIQEVMEKQILNYLSEMKKV